MIYIQTDAPINPGSSGGLSQLRDLLSELSSSDPIVLQVQRGSELRFISLYLD